MTQKVQTPTVTRTVHRTYRSKGPTAGVIIIGVSGWAAALALAGILIFILKQGEMKMEEIRKRVLGVQQTNQARLTGREAEINQAQASLTKAIDDEIDAQTKLMRNAAALRKTVAALKSQEAAKKAQVEKLKTGAVIVGEDAQLTGEGVAKLTTECAQVQQQKQDLLKTYAERYATMKALYEQKLARAEPEMIRQFYGSHQNTPFAPAALFFAAEKLYETKKSGDAQRLYDTLIKKYADSGYVTYAQQRLEQIKERTPYEKLEGVGLLPYRALTLTQ